MCCNNYLLKCVFIYILLWPDRSYAAVQGWVVQDDGCPTPTGTRGSCVLIKQCDSMITFLTKTVPPISDYVKKELNKYVCGYAETVKVCCPSEAIVIKEKDTERKPDDIDDASSNLLENPPPPPDVSEHKNFKLLPEDCGYLKSPDKIINGVNAHLNEFPWMALLSYMTQKGPKFKCGGTILNENYILTAAHCIVKTAFPLIGVRVGEHDITKKVDCEIQENGKEKCAPPIQDLAVLEQIPHPEYNRENLRNDIALLRVTKMNLSIESTRPVCLPNTVEARDAKYNNVVVTGWGRVNYSDPSSNILQKVELPVVNLTSCQASYRTNAVVKLTHKYICAGGKYEKDSCTGDSGGPLQVASYINDDIRFVQQGIVSFGHKECGLPGYPGIYTKLVYFMDWILDTIKP